MAIETWFPLAVSYEDLRPEPEINEGMRAYLKPFIEGHDARPPGRFAWTGDTKGCWQIHKAQEFQWVRRHVERLSLDFARALGVNLSVMGFYFQRAWPVIARRGEQVARHSHPNASISAVYYLQTPSDADKAGRLIFYNGGQQNSLGRGLSGEQTQGIAEWNELNFLSVNYPPVEGRLILFPAGQDHAVEANETDEPRLSLSFDIALTCSRHADPGRHEFLAPPPDEWMEFGRPIEDAPPAPAPAAPAGGEPSS